MMFGQMTAGSWIYIGSQGIVARHFSRPSAGGPAGTTAADLAGRWILTADWAGWAGAQPLRGRMAGASSLTIECQRSRIEAACAPATWMKTRAIWTTRWPGSAGTRERQGPLDRLLGNAAELLPELARRRASGGLRPDLVTARPPPDLING